MYHHWRRIVKPVLHFASPVGAPFIRRRFVRYILRAVIQWNAMMPNGKKSDDRHMRATVVLLVLTGVCLFDVSRVWGSPAPDREAPLRVRLFARSATSSPAVGRSVNGPSTVGRKTSRQPLTPGLLTSSSGSNLLDFSSSFCAPAPYDEPCSFVPLAPPHDRAPPCSWY